MYTPKLTNRFKKDLKRLRNSPRHKWDALEEIIQLLSEGKPLKPKYRDHELTGCWAHHRECHISPDWLLIYKIETEILWMIRTGSHSELF